MRFLNKPLVRKNYLPPHQPIGEFKVTELDFNTIRLEVAYVRNDEDRVQEYLLTRLEATHLMQRLAFTLSGIKDELNAPTTKE